MADQISTLNPTSEGLCDESTIKIDFDNTSFKVVKTWALRTCLFFHLEGFIILKSSMKSYHVIFNRAVSWSRNVHIMCWLALISGIESLRKYSLMQGIKESSTLRIGDKGTKTSPRVVYRWGKQNFQIAIYLKDRKNMKKALKGIRVCPLITYVLMLS
ncbi:hypothetical protein MUP77_18780 [Candidatus Bathyarchaeota archaeon]|nr:hypothetical protein [Candidatus Bathyarchaeota archaeon]